MYSWIENLVEYVSNLRIESGAYLIGGALVLVGIALEPYSFRWLPDSLYASGGVALGVGFLIWVCPRVLNLWKIQAFRRLLLFLHLGVLIASAAVATSVMSEATGLHGRDFPIAVGAISLLIYPVVWIWIATFCIGLFAIIMQILMFVRMIAAQLVSALPFDWLSAYRRPAISGVSKPLGHMLGALSVVLGVGLLASALEPSVPKIQKFGLLVAYLGDYQNVEIFPGIKPGARIVMHGEGVYSEAVNHGWGRVSLSVHRLSED